MRREVLAGLALTVLLFGSAYLAAGDGAVQEETKTEQTAGDAGVTLRVLEDGTVKDMTKSICRESSGARCPPASSWRR